MKSQNVIGMAVSLYGIVFSVHAQEIAVDDVTAGGTGATAEKEAPKSRFVEEVIVTAQKREENLQDVPISVQAFSGELLQAKGIDSPAKIQAVTPGMTYTESFSATYIYMRGLGTDAFLSGDPAVSYYVDGVYYPAAFGQNTGFGRVERIEVLKGPQGTLFGRNSTGGAISVTTETPDTTEAYTSVSSSYSSFNTFDFGVLTNLPLTDELAATATFFYKRGDHWYDWADNSPNAGSDFPINWSRAFRGKLRWEPADGLDITVGYTRNESDGAGTTVTGSPNPSLLTQLLGGTPSTEDYKSSADGTLGISTESEVLQGRMNWRTDVVDVAVMASDQSYLLGKNKASINGRPALGYDFDGTAAPIISFGAPIYGDIQTAELQLTSNEGSWGSEWLEWVGGYFYFRSSLGLTPDLGVLGADSAATGSGGGIALNVTPLIALGLPIGSIYDALPPVLQSALGPLPLLRGVIISLDGETDTEAHAVYVQSTAHLNDQVALTLGVRAQDETRKPTVSTFGLKQANGGVLPVFDFVDGSLFPQPETAKRQSISPRVNLTFRLNDDAMVYANWQRAEKSGTFNTINIYTPVDYVGPEKVEAYEVGMKADFLDGLIRLNMAAWHYDIDDLQVQFISLLTGGAISFETAQRARSQGGEVDARFILLPDWIDSLVLSVAGAYVDAKYLEYTGGSGYNKNTGFLELNQDYSGNKMVRTPKWSGSASLAKSWELGWGSVESAVDSYYTSKIWYVASNERYGEESYVLFNARVSALYEPWKLRVTLFGENLSDKAYALSRFPNDFGAPETLAAPRAFGMRVDWSF